MLLFGVSLLLTFRVSLGHLSPLSPLGQSEFSSSSSPCSCSSASTSSASASASVAAPASTATAAAAAAAAAAACSAAPDGNGLSCPVIFVLLLQAIRSDRHWEKNFFYLGKYLDELMEDAKGRQTASELASAPTKDRLDGKSKVRPPISTPCPPQPVLGAAADIIPLLHRLSNNPGLIRLLSGRSSTTTRSSLR